MSGQIRLVKRAFTLDIPIRAKGPEISAAATVPTDGGKVVEPTFLTVCKLVVETSGCALADAVVLVAAKSPGLYDEYRKSFHGEN